MQVVVMASGTGTNFKAICDATKSGELDIDIKALIVDKSDANAINIAKEYGIKSIVLNYKSYENRADYDQELEENLIKLNPDLIFLAGYMRILNREIIAKFPQRIINIHPSLLPKFPGLHAVEQAYEAKETQTGVTVHYVNEGVDSGEIINQESFAIEGLSVEQIYQRLKPIEHRLYIKTIKQLIKG